MLKRIDRPKSDSLVRRALGILFAEPTSEDYARADSVGHFGGIDLLRGIAAATILIWHYAHFYVSGQVTLVNGNLAIDRSVQPFFHVLKPIYENGYWAVELFWIISGFVLAHVYAGRATTVGKFAGARFARLYPLHLITLVTICTIQAVSLRLVGEYQIVTSNGPIGFVQNLLFVSAWGFPMGESFNGPIWSVSIEIAIYAVFFLMATWVLSFGLLIPFVVAAICHAYINNELPMSNFPLCGLFFYVGVGIYWWLLKFHHNRWMILGPACASLAMFAYLLASHKAPAMRFFNVQLFALPAIVLMVAWVDIRRAYTSLIRPLRWLGDTTYSTYLWHFPIQVFILTLFSYFKWDHGFFNHRWVLIGWVCGIVALGHLSYVNIEKPLQNFVKRQFRRIGSAPPREASTA